MRAPSLLLFLSLGLACGPGREPPPPPSPEAPWQMPAVPACDGSYWEAEDRGRLGYSELFEASGIVPSPSVRGVLWLHNDSGNDAELFAVGPDGRRLLRATLPVEMLDAEDIAAAPCPDDVEVPCLWIADTGNVARDGGDQAIVVVREPVVDPDGVEREIAVEEVLRFPLTFPDDAVDSEALVVSPDASELFLFEKVDAARARIFRLAAPFEDGVLVEVGAVDSPGVAIPNGLMITGADLHPSGSQLVLRLYTGSWEYRFVDGAGPADLGALDPLLVAFGPLSEPQGEAISYDDEGLGLWTVSEDPDRATAQVLHHYDCY